MIPLRDRYESKIDKSSGPDSCWNWTASCVKGGYGQIGKGKAGEGAWMAHRLAWEFAYGPIPEGMQVLHKCDNRKCCNPKHLFLGTQLDNMRDMIAKGRKAPGPDTRGAKSPCAKLSWEQVKDLRDRYSKGARQIDLADLFKISQSQVSAIVRGIGWVIT